MQPTHIANPVLVHAAIILAIANEGISNTKLELDDGSAFVAPAEMTARHIPQTGDYLVTQDDGYRYINPKDVFERKYREIGMQDLMPGAITSGAPAPAAVVDLQQPTEQARQLLDDGHWLTQPGDNVLPAPVLKPTSDKKRAELATAIREAGQYALRTVSENGRVATFDPDALLQNLVLALMGQTAP
jgi:hypothetical protein